MKKKLLSTKITIFVIAGIGLFFIFFIILNFSSYKDKDGLIAKLYKYTGSDILDYCDGLSLYDIKEVTYDTLENSKKLCIAYLYLPKDSIDNIDIKATDDKECLFSPTQRFRTNDGEEECSIKIVTQSALNEAYKSVFGKEVITNESFSLSGSEECYYDEDDHNYYCGKSFLQNISVGWSPTSYRFIKKVSKAKDIITIIDYFLLINQDKCYYDNFGTKENEECTKKYNNNINNRFIKTYGKKYIHTFIKKDNVYYWESTKPI